MVLIALLGAMAWVAVVVVQAIVVGLLMVVGLAVWAVIAVYGVTFTGLCLLLGPEHTAAAFFGALVVGTVVVRVVWARLQSS
jgi:hypothetical protein